MSKRFAGGIENNCRQARGLLRQSFLERRGKTVYGMCRHSLTVRQPRNGKERSVEERVPIHQEERAFFFRAHTQGNCNRFPIDNVEQMYEAYQQIGLELRLVRVSEADHGFRQMTSDPISPSLDEIEQIALDFLIEHLVVIR